MLSSIVQNWPGAEVQPRGAIQTALALGWAISFLAFPIHLRSGEARSDLQDGPGPGAGTRGETEPLQGRAKSTFTQGLQQGIKTDRMCLPFKAWFPFLFLLFWNEKHSLGVPGSTGCSPSGSPAPSRRAREGNQNSSDFRKSLLGFVLGTKLVCHHYTGWLIGILPKFQKNQTKQTNPQEPETITLKLACMCWWLCCCLWQMLVHDVARGLLALPPLYPPEGTIRTPKSPLSPNADNVKPIPTDSMQVLKEEPATGF